MHPRTLRNLRIAARVEFISLIVLLTNLATTDLKPIASLMGPVHGCAYLFVLGSTWRLEHAAMRAKATAVIPGVGGLLALRQLERAGVLGESGKDAVPS
ncbi:MAG: hypothetical protein QOF84_5908 [Streptomyces sp.]|nr:hypothetical protein [Streptomyces sp.]